MSTPAAKDGTQSGRLVVFSQGWEIGDSVGMLHPRSFTDGVESSDDSLLTLRRGVSEVSVARRTGGWKARLASPGGVVVPLGLTDGGDQVRGRMTVGAVP